MTREEYLKNNEETLFSFQTKSFEEAVTEASPPASQTDKLARIRNNNNKMEIFFRSENECVNWPNRLVTPGSVTPRIRAVSESLFLDSNISDDTTTNRDVVDALLEYNAQYVVPKDYTADQFSGPDPEKQAIRETINSSKQFLDMWNDCGCPGRVIFPIQPPYEQHYLEYKSFYQDKSFIGLGGMRHASTDEQIAAVQELRDIVGPNQWLHGFGFGCAEGHLEAAWADGAYLDSIDVSTIERLPKNNTQLDANLTQFHLSNTGAGDLDSDAQQFAPSRGHLVSGLNALESTKFIHMLAYELTGLSKRAPRDSDTLQSLDSDEALTDTGDNQLELTDSFHTDPDKLPSNSSK